MRATRDWTDQEVKASLRRKARCEFIMEEIIGHLCQAEASNEASIVRTHLDLVDRFLAQFKEIEEEEEEARKVIALR